jgi:transcriptional regulator with XRE-family HTH domain
MYRYLSGRLKQLGIRQQDLGPRMGLSQSAISSRFNDRVPWSIDEMYRLMDICQASPEELHIYFPKGGMSS